MEKILNFQVSLFGEFADFLPGTELVLPVVENLRDEGFVPATVVTSMVDSTKKQVITEPRLLLEKTDHKWQIVFLAGRIDINYVYPGGEPYFASIEEIMKEERRLGNLVFGQLHNLKGSRIAVNGHFLLHDLTIAEKQKFIKRFTIIPKIYKDNPVTEWSIRFNAPTEIEFGDKIEVCNNIIEINDILGIDTRTNKTSTRIAIGLDINTNADNRESKYTHLDIINFIEKVKLLLVTALGEIEGEI